MTAENNFQKPQSGPEAVATERDRLTRDVKWAMKIWNFSAIGVLAGIPFSFLFPSLMGRLPLGLSYIAALGSAVDGLVKATQLENLDDESRP